MMTLFPRAICLSLLVATPARGFGVAPPVASFQTRSTTASSPSSSSCLWGIRCEDKFYQLEEMEDKDTSTTELFLNADRTCTFGETDGPIPIESVGTWEVTPNTDNFKMTISRKFNAGESGKDMGEFTYDVKRTYTGEMTLVGESVGITGTMENVDDNVGEEKVGFFNMIDGTEEREGYGRKAIRMESN